MGVKFNGNWNHLADGSNTHFANVLKRGLRCLLKLSDTNKITTDICNIITADKALHTFNAEKGGLKPLSTHPLAKLIIIGLEGDKDLI